MERRTGLADDRMPIAQVRVARPTAHMGAAIRFYRDGLGLPVIGAFKDHAGFSGTMIGLPGAGCHLELTEEQGAAAPPAPSPESLLVLYVPDQAAIDAAAARLADLGHPPVPPHNPYWSDGGVTVVDPDGWHVVLMARSGLTARVVPPADLPGSA